MTDVPVQFFKLDSIPLTWMANSFYAIRIANDLFEFYLTTEAGQPTKAGLIRKTVEVVVGAVGADEINIGEVAIGKMFMLEKVTVTPNESMRFRLYQTAAQRLADEERDFGDESIRGTEHGLCFDLLLDDETGYVWHTSPPAICMNGDATMSANSYWSLTNLSGANQNFTVILQVLILG